MFKANKACVEPKPDEVLWRYMDMTRFVSLLETGSLFFCRADKFADTFEGSLAHANLREREAVGPVNPRKGIIHVPFAQMPPLTAINCWSASPHESAAMWALYCREGVGVALRITFAELSAAFEPCERWDVSVSRVAYIDYEKQAIPDTHLLAPFLHKRQSFEHEKEVRALIQRMPDTTIPETPSPFPDGGAPIPVLIARLVTDIYVAPTAPEWYLQLVRAVTKRYRLTATVRQSSLTRDPIF